MKNRIYAKVFLWMFLGLLITFGTGYYVSTNEQMIETILLGNWYWILIVLELGVVIFLSARLHKMSITTARISFLLYAFLSGLTFSSIFLVFQLSSILLIFIIAAVLFGIFAIIGYFTKIDLTKFSTYLFMGLLGIVLCAVVNMFLKNETFDIVISSVGVLVFLGFTAYDIQKIKHLSTETNDEDKIAILGALELYLDFINIFLDLLNLFGDTN